MLNQLPPLAIYIHWPFCLSKCPYCDFNSHVRTTLDQELYQRTLLRELDYYAALLPQRRITAVFFGGGTPSLMAPATVAALIARVRSHWPLATDIEITLEANPTSVEAENFAVLAAAGVNRLSLGVQSFDDNTLHFLGRQHSGAQAQQAIATAAHYFPRYSFDLIYAYAGQTVDAWAQSLRAALPFARGHISLYQLTIEANTVFQSRTDRGERLIAAADPAADMFHLTQDLLRDAGLPAYEISNHAAPGHESRHNLTYWQYNDFIGIGPGAHGRFVDSQAQRQATVAHKGPETWARQVTSVGHGIQAQTLVTRMDAQQEALMMGLRLYQGISYASWRAKFDNDLLAYLDPAKVRRLQDEKLIQLTPTTLAPTPEGAARLNAVLRYLIA